jgi:hypothetical protein
MKHLRKTIPFLIVLSLILAACQTVPSGPTQSGELANTITVEGTGSLSLSPDTARISIGVQTEAENAQDAVASNNQRVEDVFAALEEFGIPEEDIQTVNFNIRQVEKRAPGPETSSLEGAEEQTQTYRVNNTVRVTLRDIDQLGSLLDQAVQAGANTVHGIQFDAENKTDANQQALELAIQDARAKAEVIAEAAGVELGDVVRVETRGGGPVFRAEMEEMEAASAGVPISSGQLDIQVSVQVSFAIQ